MSASSSQQHSPHTPHFVAPAVPQSAAYTVVSTTPTPPPATPQPQQYVLQRQKDGQMVLVPVQVVSSPCSSLDPSPREELSEEVIYTLVRTPIGTPQGGS